MNPVHHKRSKHNQIKYYWIREHVAPEGEHRTVILICVRTADQSAPLLTSRDCPIHAPLLLILGASTDYKEEENITRTEEAAQQLLHSRHR